MSIQERIRAWWVEQLTGPLVVSRRYRWARRWTRLPLVIVRHASGESSVRLAQVGAAGWTASGRTLYPGGTGDLGCDLGRILWMPMNPAALRLVPFDALEMQRAWELGR